MLKKVVLHSVATAFASSVFPVPEEGRIKNILIQIRMEENAKL